MPTSAADEREPAAPVGGASGRSTTMRRKSLAASLRFRLSILGITLFLATIVSVLGFTLAMEDPSELRNAVSSGIIRKSIRLSPVTGITLEKSAAVTALERRSSGLWYVVSDGQSVLEYAPTLRPVLPIDVRLDGPAIAAQMRVGRGIDKAASFDVVDLGPARIVVATGGGEPVFLDVLSHLLATIAAPALFICVLFAIIIYAAITISVAYMGGLIRRAASDAAAIDPNDPRGLLPTNKGPDELVPLTTALNSALDRIAGNMDRQRRFMSNVAHELRTPLTILRSKIEAVEDVKSRNALTQDVNRLSTIVSSILQLARLQGQNLPFESVLLHDIAQEVLMDLAPMALAIGVDLALETEGAAGVAVPVNEPTVRGALANVINNALEHATGRTTIVVKVVDGTTLEVADDGVGLSADERADAVEPFSRFSRASGGVGLGLSIVRDIMGAHGGRFELLSEKGRGTKARLIFSVPGGSA
jgi:signal transduction histidine kinase